jgi:phosphatidylserine/phosphatidylglycerophosphate/cardiolipin synthase-like enzyme
VVRRRTRRDEWRDTHVRVTGPAVDGLSASFAQNWAETGHPLIDDDRRFPEHALTEGGSIVQVARGSASVGWNDMATVFRVMLESAQERVRMMTAYFVPDDCFQQLMLDAVQRGVQVDVMLPRAARRQAGLPAGQRVALLDAGGGRRAHLGLPAVDAARQGADGGRASPRSSARRT